MHWQFLVGTGLAVAFLFLPYVLKDMPPWIAWPGVLVGVLFVGWGVIPSLKRIDAKRGMSVIAASTVIAMVVAWFAFPHRPTDEILPGFAHGIYLKIEDQPVVRKKYFFDFRTPDDVHASLYLSTANAFVFSILDLYGQDHPLEIPLGYDGIPYEKFVFLICEAGSATNYSYMRVVANGKEVARIDYDHPLEMGSRQWRITLGAQANGKNAGAMALTEAVVFSTTLDDKQIKKLTDYVLGYYQKPLHH